MRTHPPLLVPYLVPIVPALRDGRVPTHPRPLLRETLAAGRCKRLADLSRQHRQQNLFG